MLVDVTPLGVTGKEAEHLLDEIGITVNKNAIPFDPLPPNTSSRHPRRHAGHDVPWLRAGRDAADRPDHHRGHPGSRRRRPSSAAWPARCARSAIGSPYRACPRRDQSSSPTSRERRLRIVIVVLPRVAALLALLLTPARAPGRRRATTWWTARRRGGSTPRPIPRGGGLAVAAAFLVMAAGFVVLNDIAALDRPGRSGLERHRPASRCSSAGRGGARIGAVDDLLRPARALAAPRSARAGARRRRPGHRRHGHRQPVRRRAHPVRRACSSRGFTVFWIVGMINSINWIDGLDGLSSGIALIAAVTLGLISLTTQVGGGQPLVAVLCFVLAGALLGFLRWNFHPATIFTGTSGVQFVGFTLAVLSILGHGQGRRRAARPGRPDHRHVLDHRPPPVAGPLAVHPRPRRTSTTGCSTWAVAPRTVLVIYGICIAPGRGRDALVRGHPGCTRSSACSSSSDSSCSLPTRGAFRRPEELEAEAYEPDPPSPA